LDNLGNRVCKVTPDQLEQWATQVTQDHKDPRVLKAILELLDKPDNRVLLEPKVT
jgi:hypothetical protein